MICPVCGKEWTWRLRSGIEEYKRWCEHDDKVTGASSTVPFENILSPWTRKTKRDREAHAKDILQPFKRDGTVNEKFRKVYGDEVYKKELKGIKRV